MCIFLQCGQRGESFSDRSGVHRAARGRPVVLWMIKKVMARTMAPSPVIGYFFSARSFAASSLIFCSVSFMGAQPYQCM